MFGFLHLHRTPETTAGPLHDRALADPQLILAREAQRRTRRGPSPMVILVAGLAAAQIAAPDPYKPSVIAGKAAADFYGAIMDRDNDKNLDLAEQAPVAGARGELERSQAHWAGLCAASTFLDPEIAAYRFGMTGAYFDRTLPNARSYRDRYAAGRP